MGRERKTPASILCLLDTKPSCVVITPAHSVQAKSFRRQILSITTSYSEAKCSLPMRNSVFHFFRFLESEKDTMEFGLLISSLSLMRVWHGSMEMPTEMVMSPMINPGSFPVETAS